MSDPWKAEQDRQAQELAEIINDAIRTYADLLIANGRQPMLNAVASALVTIEGDTLAAIEDPRHRKAMRKSMETALPQAIAKALGKAGRAQVVVVGGRKQ